MKKLVQVHRLPTEDKTNLWLDKVKTEEGYKYIHALGVLKNKGLCCRYQHLYFTSDDEIKEDNWCIHLATKEVIKYPKGGFPKGHSKKVVATTDKSLKIETELDAYYRNGIGGAKTLPQISQSFVEQYVKAGGIDEVLLEYEEVGAWVNRGQDFECTGLQLKTDQKNCVITHPVEPKLYTEEEVIKVLQSYANTTSGNLCRQDEVNNWIKENL